MKKKLLLISTVTLLMGFSSQVYAQKMNKTFSFGFGLEGVIPSGDLAESYGMGGGLTLRASYKAGPGFVTLTSGALVFAPKSLDGGENSEDMKAAMQIPIKAGYKFIYKDYLFAMAEIGYSSLTTYAPNSDGELEKISSGGLVYAPSIGFQYKSLELGLRYETFSTEGGTASFMGLRLGFNF